MAGSNSEQQVPLDVFLRAIQLKDEEIETMRKQKRDDDAALRRAQGRIAQLEKEIAIHHTSSWARGSKTDQGKQNSDASSRSFADKVMSTADAAIGKALKGKQPVMPTTKASLSSNEFQIPGKKRKKHWYNSWQETNMKKMQSNDELIEMKLPCFDPDFKHIGIARPVENPDDRHRKCYHCLQSYERKDMWDHLDVCWAFWKLAVRCGRCNKIFKLNDAFFLQHERECLSHLGVTQMCKNHYTLAADARV